MFWAIHGKAHDDWFEIYIFKNARFTICFPRLYRCKADCEEDLYKLIADGYDVEMVELTMKVC